MDYFRFAMVWQVFANAGDRKGKVAYICQDLDEAYRWSEEHAKDLKPGERYDIYYRCEEA